MSQLYLTGGKRLAGEISVQGAKNSVLPILAATILSGKVSVIKNCPKLRDVFISVEILKHLGCSASWQDHTLTVDTAGMNRYDIPDELMRQMRSSVIFLGAILARCGKAVMSYPGGCELGPRPIDMHIAAMKMLGAGICECGGCLSCTAEKLEGREIFLPLPSVGATENIILAACAARGTTMICNAAREPEIVDLQNFLNAMGAGVNGAGSSTIVIRGQQELHECVHTVIPDRIVAATYLAAVAASGGELLMRGLDYRQISTVTSALSESGCIIKSADTMVSLKSDGRLKAIRPVRTAPYPGFPTDAQAILMAAMLRARGTTVFVENIFDNRYRHVDELTRLGADVRVEGRVAVVFGVERLNGAPVKATDLRGGAALVVAALAANGRSRIDDTYHIDRGYERLAENMQKLGAEITEENTP